MPMTRKPAIDIAIEHPGWERADFDLDIFMAQTAATTLSRAAPALLESEISILLTGDQAIQALNRDYRGRDKPTNVLSFPQFGPAEITEIKAPVPLGDIVLAYETVARESGEQGKDFAGHLRHLTVHALLHLLGHDHETEAEAEAMESLEALILMDFGLKNPYETGQTVS